MAEPALKDPYDHNDSKPITRPDLKVLEGGGQETNEPGGSSNLSVLQGGLDNGASKNFAPSLLKQGEGGSAGSGGLGSPGGLYNPSGEKSPGGLRKLMMSKTARKRALIGGGVGGGVAGLIIGAFFLILPLKILHMVTSLENHFFSSTTTAVENETESLFSGYVKKQLLPGMKAGNCTKALVNKSCAFAAPGTSPVSKLYNAWKDYNLENKLTTKYGVSFEYRRSSGYFLSAPGLSAGGENITQFVDDPSLKDGNLFTQLDSKSQFRQEVRSALHDETKWYQVMFRFKVGKLLEKKYGVKRCVIACDTKDKFSDSIASKKLAAKAFLISHVIEPRSASLAIVFSCLMTDCKVNDATTNTVSVTTATNGEPLSSFDSQVQSQLDAYATTIEGEKLASLVDESNKLKNGLGKYIIQKVIEKILSTAGVDAAADISSSAVPVVGWVTGLSQVVKFLHTVGPNLKRYSFVINSASMVALFTMYRTVADEMKTGHMDATELGSMTASLSTNSDGTGSSAESTPLYNSLINSGASVASIPAAVIGSIVPRTYADTTTGAAGSNTTPQYKCNDGNPVPTGQLVCPEENLSNYSNWITNISSGFNSIPGIGILTTIAGAIGAVSGWVASGLSFVIEHIPGLSGALSSAAGLLQPIVTPLVNQLIPPVVTDDMSGGKTFDDMAGGADVAGNESAHRFGGAVLNPQQVADNINQQTQEQAVAFGGEPLFARLFDTSSDQSLISKVALAMPNSLSALASSGFASLLTDPFSKLSHSFSTIFSSNRVFAATAPQADPFGVTQYGYPTNDPVFNSDPQQIWDKYNCGDPTYTNNWNAAAAQNLDQNTYEPTNTTTNPCLLIQTAVGSAGGLFSDSTLTPDDLGASSGQ